MTRRSSKKTIHNNTSTPIGTLIHPTHRAVAGHVVYRNTLPSVSGVGSTLFKTVVLLLLFCLLLQPVVANANVSSNDSDSVATDAVEPQAVNVPDSESDDLSEDESEEREKVEQVDEHATDTPTDEEVLVNAVADEPSTESNLEQVEEAAVDELTTDASSQNPDSADEQNIIASSTVVAPEDIDLSTLDDQLGSSTVEHATSTTNNLAPPDISTTTPAASSSPYATDENQTATSTVASTTTTGGGGSSSSQENSTTATTTPSTADPGETAPSSSLVMSTTSTTTNASVSSTTDDATVVSIVQQQAAFAFNENECTLVDGGSYYCQKSPTVPVQPDDLFSAIDADGDLEIYLRRNGEEQKVTSNVVDDASPYYDQNSHTIVWHRLLNDRYQIVVYDVADGTEEVITNTKVNNMEPSRFGDTIVWQRWVEDNWEIILYQDGEERQLTTTKEHDIAPNIRGNMVIWNVRGSDGSHSLMTYDIASEMYNNISDPEGVAVSNPRMVVVYDAIYSNGDTVMKGFDLVTGELIPLQQTPAELPDELPEPDTTGETRALIATSPSKPEQDDANTDDDPNDDNDTGNDAEVGDLDLRQTGTSTAVDTASTSPVFELDLRAITIDAEVESNHATSGIEDIVVPTVTTSSSSTQTE